MAKNENRKRVKFITAPPTNTYPKRVQSSWAAGSMAASCAISTSRNARTDRAVLTARMTGMMYFKDHNSCGVGRRKWIGKTDFHCSLIILFLKLKVKYYKLLCDSYTIVTRANSFVISASSFFTRLRYVLRISRSDAKAYNSIVNCIDIFKCMNKNKSYSY